LVAPKSTPTPVKAISVMWRQLNSGWPDGRTAGRSVD
jgi:hypothetical protein